MFLALSSALLPGMFSCPIQMIRLLYQQRRAGVDSYRTPIITVVLVVVVVDQSRQFILGFARSENKTAEGKCFSFLIGVGVVYLFVA